MGRHALDTPIDTPAADWFLTPTGEPAMSEADYCASYNRRREYAAHAPARYASWRFVEPDGSTVWHDYREQAWEQAGSFYEALDAAGGMLSSSDGWEPNRALFIWDEAHAEQAYRSR